MWVPKIFLILLFVLSSHVASFIVWFQEISVIPHSLEIFAIAVMSMMAYLKFMIMMTKMKVTRLLIMMMILMLNDITFYYQMIHSDLAINGDNEMMIMMTVMVLIMIMTIY